MLEKYAKNLFWDRGLNNLGKFLLARMLYADGLNAIIIMGGIFAVGVFNLEIKDLLVLSVLMNITAFIGAIIGGYANDKFSSKSVMPKRFITAFGNIDALQELSRL